MPTKDDGLLNVELSIWAQEAKNCPICKRPWTPEAIGKRDARLVAFNPRRLACAECLVKVGVCALRQNLGTHDGDGGCDDLVKELLHRETLERRVAKVEAERDAALQSDVGAAYLEIARAAIEEHHHDSPTLTAKQGCRLCDAFAKLPEKGMQ